MNDNDKTVIIAAQIIAAEANLANVKEQPLEDRLRLAMKVGHSFWMSTDEDVRFRGSVAAVLLHCTDDERERLSEELDVLKNFSALLSGVAVDLTQIKTPDNPVGLMKMWRESNGATAAEREG